MPKWEYCRVTRSKSGSVHVFGRGSSNGVIPELQDSIDPVLDQLGGAGWELIQMDITGLSGETYFLKRPKID